MPKAVVMAMKPRVVVIDADDERNLVVANVIAFHTGTRI
jgi:hypothetical protein